MTKKREIFYGISLALVLTGAMLIEIAPPVAIGMIAVAGLSVRAAGRG